jgi:hypothetical protein
MPLAITGVCLNLVSREILKCYDTTRSASCFAVEAYVFSVAMDM